MILTVLIGAALSAAAPGNEDCARPDQAPFTLCPAIETLHTVNRARYETRPAADGRVHLFVDGERRPVDGSSFFDLTETPDGDLLWARSDASLAQSRLTTAYGPVTGPDSLDRSPVFDDRGALWFVRQSNRPRRDRICRLPSLDGDSPVCAETGHYIGALTPRAGGGVLAAGTEIGADVNAVLSVTAGADGARVRTLHADEALLLSHDGAIYRVTGDESLEAALLAYWSQALGAPAARAALGGNGYGRLSWSLAYQLHSLSELAALYDDAAVAAYVRSLRTATMQHAVDGRFPSWRYSVRPDILTTHAVHDGVIYDALLTSCERVPGEDCAAIVQQARQAYEAIEAQWDGEAYRWPCSADYRWPGDRLPWNQQNAIGLLLAHLVEADGREADRTRLTALHQGFEDATYEQDGVRIWAYWPETYYRGQEERSCEVAKPAEARPEIEAIKAEDFGHAALSVRFDARATALLDRQEALDPGAIADLIAARENAVAFRIDGSQPWEASPDQRLYGGWLDEDGLAENAYRRWIPPGAHPLNRVHFLAGYVAAAPGPDDLAGTIAVERLVQADGEIGWEPVFSLGAVDGGIVLDADEAAETLPAAEALRAAVIAMYRGKAAEL
ncbi:MAG: hypothetical protein ABL308_03075 [Oceanicaulis sp.]